MAALPVVGPDERVHARRGAGYVRHADRPTPSDADAVAALEAGRSLHEGQFSAPERKACMHTDLARAWWQWGKPEQTAAELLSALRASPGEVRDRPAIRTVVTDLRTRHAQTAGVRDLAASVGTRAA
ncbi:hypothetical protein [Streptomyces rubiginosohelvolus]|uniref:hypothetical protein n=1 Tax=Streptomyces rubiginosohelvolus TaxID=67362 RepID=UPI0036E78983